MLSRVAENIYWLARYVERAENTARLLKVNTQLMLDTPRGITPGWEPLVQIAGLDAHYNECCTDPTERNVVKFLIGDESHSGSIVFSLKIARENCRTVREILPRSAWEMLNELHLYAKENALLGISKKGREEYLNRIIAGSQQLGGLLGSVLYRDEAYHFSRIGRNLERSDMTTRILDVRSTDLFEEDLIESLSLDTLQWISVLKSMSGYQSYRRQMQIRVNREAVLQYLLKENRFPRSVIHCLDSVEESVSDLPHANNSLKKIRYIIRKVKRIDTAKISQSDLHTVIDDMQIGIMHIHNALSETYFT